MLDNKDKLNRIEAKYDALLEAVNKQNELLSMLVEKTTVTLSLPMLTKR